MKYFETLPKVIYTDNNNNKRILTNLITRVSLIPNLLKNPLLFYEYDIQESDTPEIIAHKYYGSVNRFWIVLFANQLLDPQWDWPMNYTVFSKYLEQKYEPSQLTEVHDYQKIITKTDAGSGTVTVEKINISEEEYNNLIEITNTYTLPTGVVTVQTTKNIVDNYTYELNLNESKRAIRILNKNYVINIEKEFYNLMQS